VTGAPLVIDPAWFAPEAVSAETAAFNAAMLANPRPPMDADAIAALRSGSLGPKPPESPRAAWRTIPRPDGAALRLRVIAPDNPRGAYLHLHPGGLVFGSADGHDAMLEGIVAATGLAAVSVEYRLAPEHPWPAAWDDAEAAALWLAEHGTAEVGGDRLAIGGESAGATLAVPTLVRLRDKHGFTGFHAAALTYGNYDTSGTPSNRWNGNPGHLIGERDVAFCSACYAPDPATRRDPDMSALYADVSGLPPALFTVGTLDVFLDDSLFMAARWIAAGNEAELAVWPGGIHGFTLFPHPLEQAGNKRIEAFLKARTGG
jgi:acetyl esterase/lipase